MRINIKENRAQKGCAYCYENVNIRGLKYLGYRFSKRANPISGGLLFSFFICKMVRVVDSDC
jgi:hypothetical protein